MADKINDNKIVSIPTILIGPLYYIYNNIFIGWIILVLSYPVYKFTHGSITLFILLIRNIVLSLLFRFLNKDDKKMSKLLLIEIVIIHFLILLLISSTNIEKPIIEKDHINEMYYIVNKDFISKEINNDQHFYVNHQKDNTCYLTINYSKTNISEKEYLIKETANITDPNNSINELSYNELTWYNRKIDNQLDIYIIKYNNSIYEIKFENTNEDICTKYKEELLKTITFK